MARAEQEIRNYSKSDPAMLEQAQTMKNLFDTDSADFIALYTGLAIPFATNWQTDIDDAQALPTADEEILELAVKTEDVETQMEIARVQFQKMASYVKLLFPESKAKQGIFGLEKYHKVRQSQTRMYDLMQLAHRKADSADYKLDLIALGFVQLDIDALGTIAAALYSANEAQEEFKQQIKLLTEQRVTAYNKVWGSMKTVSAASKQVYADDFVKQQQYLLYPEGEGGLPGKVQNMDYDLPTTTVSWDAAPNADDYQLERKTSAAPDWTVVYEGPDTSLVDVLATGSYLYRCRGQNQEGYGVWSDELVVLIPV